MVWPQELKLFQGVDRKGRELRAILWGAKAADRKVESI